jgi:hypothetical protein
LHKCITPLRGGSKPPYTNSPNINIVSLIPTSNVKPNNFIKSIQTKYNKPTDPPVLDVGTKIYRSGLELNPLEFFSKKKDFMFFGLDSWIAIWYALELWQQYKTNARAIPYDKWKVYLHEYDVIKPLEYKYLEDIHTNPKDEPYYTICKETPCVHPQVILHGIHGIVKEYGTELTLPYEYPIKEYLKPIKTYEIDIIQLMEMQNALSEWIGWNVENAVRPI